MGIQACTDENQDESNSAQQSVRRERARGQRSVAWTISRRRTIPPALAEMVKESTAVNAPKRRVRFSISTIELIPAEF